MLGNCLRPDRIDQITTVQPQIRHASDVYFFPCNDQFRSNVWGIYDDTGCLLPNAAFLSGRKDLGIGQEWVLSQTRNNSIIPEIECAIYGGMIGLHYGHTLLEFLPRLWYLKNKMGPSAKILVHCPPGIEKAWKTIWFRDLMELVGIKNIDIISPRYTLFVRHLLIPDASFQINGFSHKLFTEFTNWVGEKVVSRSDSDDRPIFLSKFALKTGVINFVNEDALCERLEKRGFRVESPELLTLREQIAIFKRSSGVCGILGSNMHTSIFSHQPYGVAINIGPHISDSFYLLDKVNHADFSYVFSHETREIEPTPGFRRSFQFETPALTADEIIERYDKIHLKHRKNKNIAIKKNKTLVFYKIVGMSSKYVCVRNSDGVLCSATREKVENSDSVSYVAALVINEKVIIFSYSSTAIPISWSDSEPAVEFLQCDLVKSYESGKVFLSIRRQKTGLFLCVTPDINDEAAKFSAKDPKAWEHIHLEEISSKQDDIEERLNLLLKNYIRSLANDYQGNFPYLIGEQLDAYSYLVSCRLRPPYE